MASALASALSAPGFPVTAVVDPNNSTTINITAVGLGQATDFTITGATTASFTASSTTLIQGSNATGMYAPYVTNYSYDALGNLTQVNQLGDGSQAARVRTFTYNSLSQLLTAQNPESGTITYSYDDDGELLQKTSPKPNQTGSATQTISYCYDKLNRVTGKAYSAQTCTNGLLPDGTAVVSYFYDQTSYQGLTIVNGIGRLTGLSDQAGIGAYSYDPMGRILNEKRSINGVSKTMSYEYYLDGSLNVVHYPSGAAVTYKPDLAGRMVEARDLGNGIKYVTGATYAPVGLAGFISGNSGSFAGITNAFSYDKRLQPVNMQATFPGSTGTVDVFDLNYDFHLNNGDNGNVFAIINNRDTSRNQTFTYDQLNRLASAQNTGTDCGQTTVNGKTKFWGNGYTYDAWGNLTGKGNLPGSTSPKCNPEGMDRTADAQNRLHVKPGQGADFQYDAAGNMTYNTSGQYYSYDAENRITGAGGFTYTYDADGNRVEKATTATPSTGTLYWYMAPGIVAESDLSGNLQSEYVFFGGNRVARRDGVNGAGGVFYYFSDDLKTASVITNSAGTITAESDYYPWGGELQFVNNDSNHYKFTGKERDVETSLDYFGARYYSNTLGRWLTPDWSATPAPIPYIDLTDPQTFNQYGYVRDVPTTNYDAEGHENLKPQDWGHPGWTPCTTQQCRDTDSKIGGPIFAGFAVLAAPAAWELMGAAGTAALGRSVILRNLLGLALVTAPKTMPIVVDALDGLTPGPSGTLTIAPSLIKISEQEISTGIRLAEQTGKSLVQSQHVGAEFVDAAGKTYDAMGGGKAFASKNWGTGATFMESIVKHVNKSVDKVAIDLKGASKDQVGAIKDFVSMLTKKQQEMVIYVK